MDARHRLNGTPVGYKGVQFCHPVWHVGTQGCAGKRHHLVDAMGYLAGGSPAAGVWTCPVPVLHFGTSHAP